MYHGVLEPQLLFPPIVITKLWQMVDCHLVGIPFNVTLLTCVSLALPKQIRVRVHVHVLPTKFVSMDGIRIIHAVYT